MMRRLSSRVAVAGVVVTALLLGLVGASAFVLMREQIHVNLGEAAAHAAEVEGRQLVTVMAGVVAHLQETATNPLIANALTDSVGRHAYVDPFLRGIRSVQGVPVSARMTDFLGRQLTGEHEVGGIGEVIAIAVRAIDEKQSVSALTGDEVLLASPVIYAATGTAEGALVYSFPRAALAVPRPDGTLIETVTATLFDAPQPVAPPAPSPLEGRFLFDLGNGLHLDVQALASAEALEKPEARLLGLFAVAGLVCLGLAVVGSYAVANVLTRHLRRLEEDMARVVTTASFAERLKVVDRDEVGSLALSFNMVLDKLEKAHDKISAHAEQRLNDSEARYRMLAEHASDVIARVAHDGTVRYASPAVHRLLGCAPADVAGRRLADFVHPDDRAAVNVMLASTGADTHGEVSFRAHRADGDQIWLDASAHRVGDAADGDLVTIMRDVTRRKMAEDQLAAKTQDLERSNAELEQFAYVASHDLRAPLRMVTGYLQLVDRSLPEKSEEVAEFLRTAMTGATGMDRLIQDLLSYARVGRNRPPFERLSLDDVLRDAALPFASVVAGQGGELDIAPAHQDVMGDRQELVRLFQNLIGNAVKYVPPGQPPRLHISVERTATGVAVLVADNGIGIPENQIGRIFQIFQRLHHQREYEGTGVGLAVCKKTAEVHGGRIDVTSELGKGSVFKVAFPRPADDGSAGPGPASRGGETAMTGAAGDLLVT